MILNVIPSRDKLLKYKERKTMIEQRLSSINGKFSSYTWQPVVYFYQHLEFNNLAALYQTADVALITPIRDGMNLIAKEFVASRTTQQGVLILSELAGAAEELSEAVDRCCGHLIRKVSFTASDFRPMIACLSRRSRIINSRFGIRGAARCWTSMPRAIMRAHMGSASRQMGAPW
jgi:hypothetical protein